ncbi:hypothetical protein GR268_43220 [Rhizobium leguminosarum]|nr:hypothetical protein [Rhizobium leguminosarum]
MAKSAIPATAEGMSKFDRSAIMSLAWKLYRRDWANALPANAQARLKSFSRCLKSAWMTAKHEAAEALKTVRQRAADRVQELTLELMRVDASGWQQSTTASRRSLQAEINVANIAAAGHN